MQKPRPGIVVSSVAHVAALAYAVVGFSSATPFDAQVEALPIEVITPAEFDAMTKGSKTSKKIEAPKVAAKKKADVPPPDPKPDNLPEAKQDVAAPPPPSTEKDEPKKAAEKAEPKDAPKPEPKKAEAPKPAPPPEPKPESIAKADPKPKPEKPKPEKKPDEKQQAKLDDLIKDIQKDEKPKPAEKKTAAKKAEPVFDPSKIAALVDKRDPSRKAQAAPETASYSTAGTATGTAPKLSISQQQMIVGMIRDQISPCWNPPVGASGAEGLDVLVHFGLNADGSLSSNPRAVNSSNNPAFRAAVDSASRAVVRCSPLHLPQQYYEAWKEVTISFDPREMAGG